MGLTFAEQYNRARWLSTKTRQFITRDVLWPRELPYGYVAGNPTTWIDPTGLAKPFEDCPADHPIRAAWVEIQKRMRKACANRALIDDCWKKCGEAQPEKEGECFCKHGMGSPGYGVDIACYESSYACKYLTPGGCMGATRGSWRSNCRIRVCLNGCPDGLNYAQALMHELMHCCGASHDKRNRDCQADPDCLERCLEPLLGFIRIKPSDGPSYVP